MAPETVDAARQMLCDPRLMLQVRDDIQAVGVAGESDLIITEVIVGVSRLLPDPLAAITRSASSTGKSFVLDRVAETFPPEAIVLATTMTPKALAYMRDGSLKNRWVVAGERSRMVGPEAEESKRLLRELLSAKRLNCLSPFKDDSGVFQTRRITQEGPIAFSETTSLQSVFHEDANRCLLLSADEREQQSRTIVRRIAADRSGTVPPVDRDAIIRRHWAMHRLLEQVPVVVPFASQLAERFPADRVESRRGIGQLFSLIQTHALLYQFQRGRDGNGCVIATLTDYACVRPLALLPFSHLLAWIIHKR